MNPWKNHIIGIHPYNEPVLKLKLLSLCSKSALTVVKMMTATSTEITDKLVWPEVVKKNFM